ncbi:HDOD domain-containing protein [uncultured Salinisphaera sp.]|uniref:EAL and HDOD domain-containing protein n=1 Tax=uncultured Salinisphaera sp. TaxID=359372 RepID=UPI0032B2C7F0
MSADPTNASNTTDILFARQPIYDRDATRRGFELLFRQSASALSAPVVFDGEAATRSVLVNAFSEADIEVVCEGNPAFVNFTEQTIAEDLPFDPAFLVVEVLESVNATPVVFEALTNLRRLGFKIALDDYTRPDADHPLLSYADIVKLEYPAYSNASLAQAIEALRTQYPQITLLAEKIETHEDFEQCRQLGCDLFQGYFLARPEAVFGRPLPAAHVRILELLARLNDPNAGIDQIGRTVSEDPYLSLRVLKLVNSSLFGMAREITSLDRAILALGLNRLRAFASLLALSGLQRKPLALQYIAISRSFICQTLCEHRAGCDGPMGFMIGLLSCLDAFTDRPLAEVLAQAPFDPKIVTALLDRQGPLGVILDATLAHERGELEQVPWARLQALGIEPETFMAAFRQSVATAHQQMQMFH